MDESTQPWEAVHAELQRSREERLTGTRCHLARGGAAECPFRARVLQRTPISDERTPRTTKVTLALPDGLDWSPGDRLMVLPPNSEADVADALAALHRGADEMIGLDDTWGSLLEHIEEVLQRSKISTIFDYPLGKLVRLSVLRPLGLDEASEGLWARHGVPHWSVYQSCTDTEQSSDPSRSIWSCWAISGSNGLCVR